MGLNLCTQRRPVMPHGILATTLCTVAPQSLGELTHQPPQPSQGSALARVRLARLSHPRDLDEPRLDRRLCLARLPPQTEGALTTCFHRRRYTIYPEYRNILIDLGPSMGPGLPRKAASQGCPPRPRGALATCFRRHRYTMYPEHRYILIYLGPSMGPGMPRKACLARLPPKTGGALATCFHRHRYPRMGLPSQRRDHHQGSLARKRSSGRRLILPTRCAGGPLTPASRMSFTSR